MASCFCRDLHGASFALDRWRIIFGHWPYHSMKSMNSQVQFAFVFYCSVFLLQTTNAEERSLAPMTVTELTAQAAKAQTGDQQEEVVRYAFASKRPEMVKALFHAPNFEGLVTSELFELEPSAFRDSVVLSLMEEEWRNDADARIPAQGSLPPPMLAVLSLRVLAAKLPEEGLSETDPTSFARLSKRAKRMGLVKLFRERTQQGNVQFSAPKATPSRGDLPGSQTPRPRAVNGFERSEPQRPETVPVKKLAPPEERHSKAGWLWWLAGTVVLGVSFWVWKVRKGRSRSS